MSAGQNMVARQRRRAKKFGVDGQGAYGQAVAVGAQIVQLNVGGHEGTAGVIEEQRVAGMTIIVTALGLAPAHLGQLGVAVNELIAAGTDPNATGAPLLRESKLVGAPVEG